MPSDQEESINANDVMIRPSSGLIGLPDGDSLALSEIINRSPVDIQTSNTLAVSECRAGEESQFEIAPGASIVMCWIPPGEFLMGSPPDRGFKRPAQSAGLAIGQRL
jgi:hypothetical protein